MNSKYPSMSATELMYCKQDDPWLKNEELHDLLRHHSRWVGCRGRDYAPMVLQRRQSDGIQIAGTQLCFASFIECDFIEPRFISCDLRNVRFDCCKFPQAYFEFCDLRGATFNGCDLRGARFRNCQMPAYQICPETGEFIGWKVLASGVIAKLKIPAEAKRTSTLVGRKCRAEFVEVLEFTNVPGDAQRVAKSDDRPVFYGPTWDKACEERKMYSGFRSLHSGDTVYVEGQIVRPDKYDDDFRIECTHGIHFFMTEREARDY